MTEEHVIRALIGKSFVPECVINAEVDNISLKDYPKFTDVLLSDACWKVDGLSLTDDELDIMQEKNPVWVYELAHNSIF